MNDQPKRRRGVLWILWIFLILVTGGAVYVWWWNQQNPGVVEATPTVSAPVSVQPTVIARQAAPTPEDTPDAPEPVDFVSDSSADTGRLSGRVISRGDGQGIDGAELTFVSSGAAYSVTTSANGAFAFTPPERGRYELASVQARGFLPYAPAWGHSQISFMARRGERIRGAVIQLTPAVDYTGVVMSPDGRPVRGARIEIVGSLPEIAEAPIDRVFTSGEDGTFVFRAPDDAVLEATHGRYGPGRAQLDFRAQISRRLVIQLGKKGDTPPLTRSIGGQVLFPAADGGQGGGDPAPGAMVRVENEDVVVQDLTDHIGRFVLPGLPAGHFRVEARLDGYVPAADTVPAGTPHVVLVLSRGATVSGRVTRANGVKVPSFTVVLDRMSGIAVESQTSRTVYDSGGRYALTGIPDGDYRLRVLARDLAPFISETFTIAGEDHELDATLRVGATVRGVVVSAADGQGVPQARVGIEGAGGSATSSNVGDLSVVTGDDGTFEMVGVEPGRRTLVVTATGFHMKIHGPLEIEDEQTLGPETIELTPVEEGEEPAVELVGIGAVLRAAETDLEVQEVIEGGGAAEAGMTTGDRIEAIDGTTVEELGFENAIQQIRGVEGSVVVLRVHKADTDEVLDLEVTRKKIRG